MSSSDVVAQSPSSSSRALVVPAPPSQSKFQKPKEKVLDEDTYIEALSTIIKRDFYPDLAKLEAQAEWLKAEETNDVEKMRELQQRMMSARRPTDRRATPRQTPRATPAGFETPVGATPIKTEPGVPLPPSSTSNPLAPSPSAGVAIEKEEAVDGVNTNMTLDKFINKHTSEDDASFIGIMEKQHERHQEKYGWIENKSQEAKVMMIEAGTKDAEGHYPAVQTWNYTVRNQLMYVPDGEDARLMPPPPPGPPKEIIHRNTRITAPTSQPTAAIHADPAKKEGRDAIWAMMTSDRQLLELRKAERAAAAGRVDLADLLGTPRGLAESPRVGGYGFVATPSPAPGVDMSPMTTWGRLDGTPLLLDPTDTPLDLTPGPTFHVPDPPKREELAMKLADKAKESMKARRARTFATSSPSPYGRPSPALSPAGRSLIASKLSSQRKTKVGTDLQLRASYNSPAVGGAGARAHARGGVTPSPLPTPSPSPLNAAKSATPSHAASITDDLLDLNVPASPARTPAKGKSITDNLLNI